MEQNLEPVQSYSIQQPAYILTSTLQQQQDPKYIPQGTQPQQVVVISEIQQTQYLQRQELQQPCSTQQQTFCCPFAPMPQQFNEVNTPTDETHLLNEDELVDCCGAKKRPLYVYLVKSFALLAVAFTIMALLCMIFAFSPLAAIYRLGLIISLSVSTLLFILLLFFLRNRFPFNVIFLFLLACFFGVTLGCPAYFIDPSFAFAPLSCLFYSSEMCFIYLFTKKEISIGYVIGIGCADAIFVFGVLLFIYIFQFWFFVAMALALALEFCMIGFVKEQYKKQLQ